MRETAQVVIIGAGVMGCSVAYHLVARGITDVLLLEQAPQPATGSTGRSAAGVRHQFSTETNVRLSQYSITRLKHFRDETGGDSGLHQIGYLFVIDTPEAWAQYQRNVEMQRGLGVRVELLTPDEAARYVPGLRTDDLLGATFGPDDGFCDPHGVASGYLRRAQQLGARLQCDTSVQRIVVDGEQIVAVQTARGEIACEVVVNAAGPWAGAVAATAGLNVPVSPVRRSIYVTESFPAFPQPIPLTLDVSSGVWMRKQGERALLGLARKDEPSSTRMDVDWDWWQTVRQAAVARCPLLADAVIDSAASWAGLYEVTPDANPILGRHPALPTYLDVSGFSGHGIMHAPAAGLLITEEIVDGRAHTMPIDDLRITRFLESSQAERNVF